MNFKLLLSVALTIQLACLVNAQTGRFNDEPASNTNAEPAANAPAIVDIQNIPTIDENDEELVTIDNSTITIETTDDIDGELNIFDTKETESSGHHYYSRRYCGKNGKLMRIITCKRSSRYQYYCMCNNRRKLAKSCRGKYTKVNNPCFRSKYNRKGLEKKGYFSGRFLSRLNLKYPGRRMFIRCENYRDAQIYETAKNTKWCTTVGQIKLHERCPTKYRPYKNKDCGKYKSKGKYQNSGQLEAVEAVEEEVVPDENEPEIYEDERLEEEENESEEIPPVTIDNGEISPV